MKRTEILCPECFNKKLIEHEDEVYCDGCGTEFIKTVKNSLKYK